MKKERLEEIREWVNDPNVCNITPRLRVALEELVAAVEPNDGVTDIRLTNANSAHAVGFREGVRAAREKVIGAIETFENMVDDTLQEIINRDHR